MNFSQLYFCTYGDILLQRGHLVLRDILLSCGFIVVVMSTSHGEHMKFR